LQIAYVLNTYPAPSHSFIRREIAALERKGLTVHRMAMRPHDGPLPDPADQAEAARTHYVLATGIGVLLWALWRTLLVRPGGLFGALAQALRMGRRSEAGLVKHLIYWVEGAHVARRARDLGAERLHAHFGTNAATVALLAQMMGGPDFSFTVHGPEEFDKPALIGLAEKLHHADFAVAISSYGRSQLCRLIPPRLWSKVKVVHCGIEPEAFEHPAPMPPGRPLRLVCIGRFAEQKGLFTLIDALAEAVRRGVDVHLVLIGDGPLRPMIEASIAHHRLRDHVYLTGWLDETGVRMELAQAQCIVLPSFAEGLPVVLMEAMVAARPVVSTWVAGIPELVQPGRNGWLVPPADHEALADAIVDLSMTAPETLARMGKSARARALTRHSIDTEAAKLALLFAQRPRTQPD
jgi:colanic acid/amylovoran biosynthesis glycosyltransferase